MAKHIARAESALISRDFKTTSLIVAEKFGKRHDHVIRSIEALDLPEAYRLLNFGETVIERPNPSGGAPIRSKAYTMTRDGFSLLVMGFTGKRALGWKIRFLEAFNEMERQIAHSAPQAAISSQTGHTTPEVLEWALTVPLARDLRVVLAELARLASPMAYITADVDQLRRRLRMSTAALEQRLDILENRGLIAWRYKSLTSGVAHFLLLAELPPDSTAPRVPTMLRTQTGPCDNRPITWAQLRYVLLDAANGGSSPTPELERLLTTFCVYQEAEWPVETGGAK